MTQNDDIAQQQADEEHIPIPVQIGASTITPVFGTAEPSRGPATAIRRAAYKYPAHTTTRWMLLIAADRVERNQELIKDSVLPGRQPLLVRHFLRQARAYPPAYTAAGLAALAGVVLVARRRR